MNDERTIVCEQPNPRGTTMEALESIDRLTKDLRNASMTLSDQEARFLVDTYYEMQENRKRAANQARALNDSGEPHNVLQWLFAQSHTLEKQVARALDAYSSGHPLGQWARSVVGIGPIIAAGLLAHIDFERAPTAGAIWRFAGLDPTMKWEKGQKRPWNASLKTLCWKIGESFVKVSGNDDSLYGRLYKQRKELELAKNERGDFEHQAEAKLAAVKIGKATEAYKHYSAGRLPPAHIHSRAKRYAVKMFLSHYHEIGYRLEFGRTPAKPFALSLEGHSHYVAPEGV